jgi:Leucine-rich repeat (LRR) protein
LGEFGFPHVFTFISSWHYDIILIAALAILSWPNSDNFIEGSIPSTITKLRNLQELKLGDNFLISSLPSELGKMKQMEILQVHVSPKFALRTYFFMDSAYNNLQFSFGLSPEEFYVW